MTRRSPLVADPERYTPMEWADACVVEWHDKILPLRTALLRLAEGCDHPDGVFAGLQHSLGRDLEGQYHWGRGSIFACDDQAVVAYLPPASVVGPFRSLNERARTWFQRHHGHGVVVSTRLEQWDRQLESLAADVPASLRRGLTEITSLYLRVTQDAAATPAVVAAGRRLAEMTRRAELATNAEREAAASAMALARSERERLYVAAARLARRRLLGLSASAVVRL